MLPLPFIDYIPQQLRQNINAQGQAFVDKIEELLTDISEEVLALYWLKLPERCPAKFLDELGFWLSAELNNFDTERDKRKKIYQAIEIHKRQNSWTQDLKIKCDNITGYSAQIIKALGTTGKWVLIGDGTTPSTYKWASLGADDGTDPDLGLALIGDSADIEQRGNIFINLHPSIDYAILTEAVVQQAYYEIEGKNPLSYFNVFIGYINSAGNFANYDGAHVMAPFILSDGLTTFQLSNGDDLYYNTTTIIEVE